MSAFYLVCPSCAIAPCALQQTSRNTRLPETTVIIQCPLNRRTIERLDDFVQAGAGEFYFGYRNELAADSDCLNRRFGDWVNFDSADAAAQAVRRVKRSGRKAFIVLNELSFPEHWHDTILEEISQLSDSGADGFIVSDINLIVKIRESGLDVFMALSSTTHVLNARAAAFFRSLGVNRLVLPRQLDTDEITAILLADSALEYELIVMNEECPNLEGLCSFAHIQGENSPNLCRQALLFNTMPPGAGYVVDSCGACALHSFKPFSGLVLKIAGRGIGADWILNDIVFLNKAVSMLEQFDSAYEYAMACATERKRIYKDPCRRKCYFHTAYLPEQNLTGGDIPACITQGVVKYGKAAPHPEMARETIKEPAPPE